MANLVLLMALLVTASFLEAGAEKVAVKAPEVFSLKCIIHNVADRCVTVGLSTAEKGAGTEVEAEPGCWTALGPVDVSCRSSVVHLCATVTNDKGVTVSKSFPLNLAAQFGFVEPGCLKTLPITACESVRSDGSKCLEIKIGHEKMLSLVL